MALPLPPPPPPPAVAGPPPAARTSPIAATSGITGAANPLDPNVRTLWFVQWLITAAMVGGLVALILLIVSAASEGAVPVAWVLVGVVVAVALAVLGRWHARAAHERWSWTLTEQALELRHGVTWRTVSAVPYTRLQQIDVDQGPVERRLGIVTLRLRTAAATTDGAIPGIRADRADEVRAIILGRAGRGDAV